MPAGLSQLVMAALGIIDNRLLHIVQEQVAVRDNRICLGPDVNSHRLNNNSIFAVRANGIGDESEVARLALDADTISRLARAAVVLEGVLFEGVAARGVGGNLIAKINTGAAVSAGGVPNKDIIRILMP